MTAEIGGIEDANAVRPRGANRLTDRGVRAFLARARAGTAPSKKLSDGAGLYIMATPAGSGVWRMKYYFAGKERVFAIGLFPEISLVEARAQRDVVKGYLREGRDPVQARKVSRAAAATSSGNTFSRVAEQWLAKRKHDWSKIHYEKTSRALVRDVLPSLGPLPIAEITPPMIAGVIETVTRRGVTDTANKIAWNIICVFRFAQAKGLCTDNPAIPVRELLPKRSKVRRRPALLELEALRGVLKKAELAALSPSIRLANRLCAFTAQRIGNIVEAEWSEFDLNADIPTWTIARSKMKAKEREFDQTVILGPTIAAELAAWKSITGGKGYVFPSPTGNAHITREGVEKVYKQTLNLRGKHSPHGWRASFSTLARDAGYARDVVELTLDHVHDNQVSRAYDRGERLEERKRLMNWWDAQLAGDAIDPKVIPFRATA